MGRLRKRTILIVAALSGIGLSYLIQPFFPPYRARGRVAFIGPEDARQFNRDIDSLAQSVIRSRRTPHTGNVGMMLKHPGGRENQLEIVIRSQDREFSRSVVDDLLSHAREAGGANVEAIAIPRRDLLAEPSPPVLVAGIALAWWIGFMFVRRFSDPEEAP